MPRLKRRSYKNSGLTDQQRDHLLDRGIAAVLPIFPTDDDRRRAWEANRHALLPVFVAEHPLQRPRAWWDYDAPEPRLRIDGGVHPFDDPAYRADAEAGRAAGGLDLLATYLGLPRFSNIKSPPPSAYEGIEDYLRRLDLLLPSEGGNDE